MRSLLDDLNDAPTPLSIPSKKILKENIKAIHSELMRAQLFHQPPAQEDLSTVRDLRRYALWLEHALELFPEDHESLAALAAALYEFVASFSPPTNEPNIFSPPLNDLLRSALLSSLTPYQAQSSLLGRRVRDELDSRPIPSSATAACHLLVAKEVSSFVGRDFSGTVNLSATIQALVAEAIDEIRESDVSSTEIDQLDLALALAMAVRLAAAGMLGGSAGLIQAAVDELDRIRNAASTLNDVHRFWLADRLLRLARLMYDTSMHRVLSQAQVSARYRRELAQDGYLELWGPQLEAIRNGLVSPEGKNHFVVAIPTGAGKTLLAELSIISALDSADAGWALYVAPSRALVGQVSIDLRRRLQSSGIKVQTIVAGAEQTLVLEDELLLIQAQRTVTVTTPEKFDAYYRNSPDTFDTCQLVIFDEVHKIDESERGTLVETLIVRMLVQHPDTRLMLMSGVMSNAEELAAWIGEGHATLIYENRRPSRQVRGVAVRQADSLTAGKTSTRNGRVKRKVAFAGGLVIVHDNEDLSWPAEVDIPNAFEGFYTEQSFGTGWREVRGSGSSSSVNQHAVQLAQQFAMSAGTVLVFMQNPSWAESSARRFVPPNDELHQTERRELAQFIRAELGEGHDLPDLCMKGVAYHHARLPSTVQRALELALERGWLKTVFTTATLREGINTPATTVIIAGDSYWDNETNGWTQMREADYSNLAGRAGRPGTDTEGSVLLIPNSLAVASALESGKRYILAGEAALRVRSQLNRLGEALDQSNNDFLSLPLVDQRLLLSLEAAGLDDERTILDFFSRSLWALQEESDTAIVRASVKTTRALWAGAESVGKESFHLAAMLGLSLASAELLRSYLISHSSTFFDDEENDVHIDGPLSVLLEASLQLTEIRKGFLNRDVSPLSHLPPLNAWIAGLSYSDILRAGKDSGIFRATGKLGDAVKYCADLSTWLSWSFGAAITILDSIDEHAMNSSLKTMPLLVRYGVPNVSSALIALLGISDRKSAQMLGSAFENTGQAPSLTSISAWLEKVHLHNLFTEEEFKIRGELAQRQMPARRSSTSAYDYFRYRPRGAVELFAELKIRLSEDSIFLMREETTVGELLPTEHRRMRTLMRNALGGVTIFSISRPARDGTAAILAIPISRLAESY